MRPLLPSPGLRTHRRRWRFAAPAALLVAGALVPLLSTTDAGAAPATVSVNAGQSLGTIPAGGQGVNFAVYDGHMNDSAISGLLSNAGVNAVRYPGGSFADIYHWQTNTADGGFVAPNTNFDTFMTTVRAAGAQPVVIANYGSGTAQEAADWVRYANITKGYGARLWEIGNEVYGNGHYGAQWEQDNHADKSPRAYANGVVQYISAMKAVDPSIKVGVVLTTPGGWPDSVVGSGDSADWNHTVMSIVGNRADFAIVHWYPGATSAADSLTKPATIASLVGTVRSVLNQFGATNTAITVTETNPSFQLTTATAALFATDSYLTWWENGVSNVDWWNTHNGAGGAPSTGDDGTLNYNDEGVLSSGSANEPPVNTPFPPYYGIAMLKQVGAAGDTLVRSTSSNSAVISHAVRTRDGGLNVVLINKDLSASADVTLSYTGFTPAAGPTVSSWVKGATSITTRAQGTATTQTLPPYSITSVHLRPAGSTPPTTTPPTSTPPTSPPPTSPAAGGCAVAYRVSNSWAGGFTADVTITNRASTAVTGWTLGFGFGNGQQITGLWNGSYTQTGAAVSVHDAGYNAGVAPGGSTAFGFQANVTGTNTNPSAFTLNGTTCTTS
ncbi:MAG: hypothetical protein V7637_2728 [Mycobacteriales bacterium]